jgi:predicted Fe-Mo cluster-binding NifX family protein
MKIAVSADGSNFDARVAQRFGISAYLIIVDPETIEFETVPNPGASGQRAAGVQAVVLTISKGVDTVLTGYCSPTAIKYLSDSGIDVVTGVKGMVSEAVAQYKKQAHAIPMPSKGEPVVTKAPLLHVLKSSGILRNLMIPLSLVFTFMVLMNLFFKPVQIIRFLGKESGVVPSRLASCTFEIFKETSSGSFACSSTRWIR